VLRNPAALVERKKSMISASVLFNVSSVLGRKLLPLDVNLPPVKKADMTLDELLVEYKLKRPD